MSLSLSIVSDPWTKINTVLFDLLDRAPKTVNCKDIMPGAYQGGRWKLTTLRQQKTPCVICSQIEPEMFSLRATVDTTWTTPLTLCKKHHREWKTENRTRHALKTHLRFEQAHREELKHSGRPRNPAGWNIDLAEIISSFNEGIRSLTPVPIPDISDRTPAECLEAIRQAKTMVQMLADVQATSAMIAALDTPLGPHEQK